jgi:hypothetical protein
MVDRLLIQFSPNLCQAQPTVSLRATLSCRQHMEQNRTFLSGMGNQKSRLVPIEGN